VLLSEQYDALRKQIPLMYVLMFINIVFLGVSTYGDVPLTLSLGMPAAMSVAITVRAALWLRRRTVAATPSQIRDYFRGTIAAAAVLSLVFGAWGVLLFEGTDSLRSSSVALYIFVGTISCCYCLLTLPVAGRLVLLFGAMPVTVQMLLSNDRHLVGIALNFLMVALIILRTMATSYGDFTEVVRSRSNMQAERERARGAELRAQQLAYSDALTGLPNRRALSEQLDTLPAQDGPATRLALLVLDLDRFKSVNDVHGHPAGDRLLQAVATRLVDTICSVGTAYRVGGDEFAVTIEFPEWDRDPTAELAQRIVATFAQPFLVEGLLHHIGASVGVSVSSRRAADRETLMRQADIALYKSKEQGRSQYQAFHAQMDVDLIRRSMLERDLRADINNSAFVPFYQPIVNLTSGDIAGFEMLARWKRVDGRQIGPNQFIPIAEECGLVGELMFQLLEQACVDAVSWPSHVTLAINVSPVQLKDPWFSEKVLAVLARTRFPAPRLTLEITENALISEPENAQRLVESLKNQGMLLALDDFGTGFSSIQHLRMLPFDKIKIDRSFVQELERGSESYKMVFAITQLAKSLSLGIVAEGIEKESSLELIRELGCAEAQGYLLGRPMDARAAAQALRKASDKAAAERD
jgi:diguanylate cyclase (GGDEF)-like protein